MTWEDRPEVWCLLAVCSVAAGVIVGRLFPELALRRRVLWGFTTGAIVAGWVLIWAGVWKS